MQYYSFKQNKLIQKAYKRNSSLNNYVYVNRL